VTKGDQIYLELDVDQNSFGDYLDLLRRIYLNSETRITTLFSGVYERGYGFYEDYV